jgi:hypothetical protein
MYKHIAMAAALMCSAAFAEDVTSKPEGNIAPTKTATIDTLEAGTAPPAAKSATVSFESIDRNGDGRISRTEAGMDKRLSNIFGNVDTNGDGYISKAEYILGEEG